MTGQPAGLPLVSVVIIFLDAREFFAEAVESVLRQTYPDWELVLVDDGSTDGTSDLARRYASQQPHRVRYIEHAGHRRRGMSASRNAGWRQARGSLIAFLDADDVWLKDKLEVQVAQLQATPRAEMVAGTTRVWHGWTGRPDDERRDAIRHVTQPEDMLYEAPELLRRYLSDRALTPATCSALIRRDAIERIGGFEERFTGLYEDQAFFLKAYRTLPVLLTSSCSDLYRQHPHSHSAEALRTGRYSAHEPSAALVHLMLWLTRYLIATATVDPAVWWHLSAKLSRIAVNRTMARVNRPVKGVLAWWYRLRHSEAPESNHGGR